MLKIITEEKDKARERRAASVYYTSINYTKFTKPQMQQNTNKPTKI